MRGRFLRLVTDDLGTKLLALAIAGALWIAVTFLGTRTVTTGALGVSIVSLPLDVAVASDLEPVRVKFRAPRALLRERAPDDLVRVFVDLSGRGIGAQSADVAVSPADPRVDVILVLPVRVNLTLDPVVRRSLPVRVALEGTPAEGYRVSEETIEPETTEVRGALGMIQQISAIDVRVPVGGATATLEGEFPLAPPEALVVEPSRVRVRLIIIQTEETKTLGVRVVTRGTPAKGYWLKAISTDPTAVTLKGPRDILDGLAALDTVAVDVDEARSEIESAADLVLPKSVVVVGSEPRVRVRVDIVPLEGSKEVSAAVTVQDVASGLRVASVSPASLRVAVRGTGEAFDRLRGEDVRVVLTASGRGAEAFSVRPTTENVRVPDGVRVVSLEGADVAVALEQS